MKKLFILLASPYFLLSFYACDNGLTYADELRIEKELINKYIEKNKIKLIPDLLPTDKAWPVDEFYKTEDGMYFNLLKPGAGLDSIESGDEAILRFKSYTLGQNPDSVLNWTPLHYPYPPTFTYYSPDLVAYYESLPNVNLEACRAWYLAISYMKRIGSEAVIIVPSKMGFTSSNANPYWGVFNDSNPVTPRVYVLQLMFKK